MSEDVSLLKEIYVDILNEFIESRSLDQLREMLLNPDKFGVAFSEWMKYENKH